MRDTIYFERLDQIVDDLFKTVARQQVVLAPEWVESFWQRGPVAYGETRAFNFEIATLKGKPTRKWFHISIYRLDSGRYELTTYIL